MPKKPRIKEVPTPKPVKRKVKPEELKIAKLKASSKVEKKYEKISYIETLPVAVVSTYLHSIKKYRKGKGFSNEEIQKVGLNTTRARKLGLRIDPRRSTELTKNVEVLKSWIKASKIAINTKKSNNKKMSNLKAIE